MEFAILGSLGLLGYKYLNNDYNSMGIKVDTPNDHSKGGSAMTEEVTKYKDPAPKKANNMFNYSEMGITYGLNKPHTLAWSNLNEAYKPRSAPMQRSTSDLVDIFEDQAEISAYLEATGAAFYFDERQGSIPVATSQQSNPLVEVPPGSLKGDRNKSLLYYPRVYVDRGEEIKKTTSEPYDKFLDAGMPETSEKKYVPLTGRLNRASNPWGNGGKLNRVFTKRQEFESERRGADRAVLMQPVFNSRLSLF